MNLKQKLVVLTLLIGIVPALIIGLVSIEKSRATLEIQVFEQLQAQGNIKADQIQQHFKNARNSIETLADSLALLIEKQGLETAMFELDQRGQTLFSRYTERNDYYDLFLLDTQGYCFFSTARDAGYKTNLVSGLYKDSGLGQVVQKAIADQQYHMSILMPYAPSNDAFITAPVKVRGAMVMVLAVQISLAGIDQIIAERTGVGETGETYLVAGDLLMGSDSLLGGTGGQSIDDHSGKPVLSSYASVPLTDGVEWNIVSEIGVVEAFAPIDKLQSMLLIIVGAGAVFLVLLALSLAAATDSFSHRGSMPLGGNIGSSKDATNKSTDDAHVLGEAIADVSRRIADIITVIEDLAFHTSLLASNDSDEATREGEHGTVSVEEVRALAERAVDALTDQAAELNELMQFFRLEEQGQAPALAKTKPMPEHQDIKQLVSDLRS